MDLTDPCFDPPLECPFPPGTSPFRQKGNVVLGNREFLDARVAGGEAAVLSSLASERLVAFFAREFAASEWYDALPNVYLHKAAARRRGLGLFEHGRQLGAWHADTRMRGIYGALLRVLSTESVAVWAPRISSVYYDFGRLDTRVEGERSVRVVRRGIPGPLVRWLGAVMTGMAEQTLTIAGARQPRVVIDRVRDDGAASGQRLYAIEGSMSWS